MEEVFHLSDEEIVELIRQGNSSHMNYMMNKYKGLVREKARTMYLIGGDNDDLIQEGMIGLFQAIRGYDKTKQASFHTFASLCITRQIYTAVQSSRRQKHVPLNTSISLNAAIENHGESVPLISMIESAGEDSPETMLIEKETIAFLKKEMNRRLSPLERQVAELYLDGRNYDEIAGVIGKSAKSVDNALSRIKMKLNDVIY